MDSGGCCGKATETRSCGRGRGRGDRGWRSEGRHRDNRYRSASHQSVEERHAMNVLYIFSAQSEGYQFIHRHKVISAMFDW